jgi:hypothetical protein
MNRRDCFNASAGFAILAIFSGCTVAWENENTTERRRTTDGKAPDQPPRGRSRSHRPSGPTDIKALSKLLLQAGYPLNEGQIDFLLTLKEGPEFVARMNEVLDAKQIDAVKTGVASGRRGGRRRRR